MQFNEIHSRWVREVVAVEVPAAPDGLTVRQVVTDFYGDIVDGQQEYLYFALPMNTALPYFSHERHSVWYYEDNLARLAALPEGSFILDDGKWVPVLEFIKNRQA